MSPISKLLLLGKRLLVISYKNPRRLSTVLGTALAVSENCVDPDHDVYALPEVSIESILPQDAAEERVVLALFPQICASVSYIEYFCLAALLKKVKASSVFEFGTYKGVSITQLALNVPDTAVIRTLDLPEGKVESRFAIRPDDQGIAAESGKGALVPANLKSRIQFLKSDSAQFDESPYADSVDFIFVDGAHNLDYVRNDSEKGWRMLRKGGVMVWHDFCINAPDVVRYLLQAPFDAKHISGTTLAYAIKTRDSTR